MKILFKKSLLIVLSAMVLCWGLPLKADLYVPLWSSLSNFMPTESDNFLQKPNSFFRRTEVIFFISLGFSIFYSNRFNAYFLNYTKFIQQYLEHPTRSISVGTIGQPQRNRDPENLFLWVNSITWSVIVTYNSIIEAQDIRSLLFPSHPITNKKERTQYRYYNHFTQSGF